MIAKLSFRLPLPSSVPCVGIGKRRSTNDFHISDYSIWEDFEIEGWPVMTILRGTVAVEDGQVAALVGEQWISRKVDREVTSRPVG